MKKLALDILKAALFLYAVYSLFLEVQVFHGGIYAYGKVVNIDCKLPLICSPQIEFQTANHQLISYKFSLKQSLLFKAKTGDKIGIIYDEKSPHEVVINNFWDKWFNLIEALISILLAFIIKG